MTLDDVLQQEVGEGVTVEDWPEGSAPDRALSAKAYVSALSKFRKYLRDHPSAEVEPPADQRLQQLWMTLQGSSKRPGGGGGGASAKKQRLPKGADHCRCGYCHCRDCSGPCSVLLVR